MDSALPMKAAVGMVVGMVAETVGMTAGTVCVTKIIECSQLHTIQHNPFMDNLLITILFVYSSQSVKNTSLTRHVVPTRIVAKRMAVQNAYAMKDLKKIQKMSDVLESIHVTLTTVPEYPIPSVPPSTMQPFVHVIQTLTHMNGQMIHPSTSLQMKLILALVMTLSVQIQTRALQHHVTQPQLSHA